jgi:hypothetical protein
MLRRQIVLFLKMEKASELKLAKRTELQRGRSCPFFDDAGHAELMIRSSLPTGRGTIFPALAARVRNQVERQKGTANLKVLNVAPAGLSMRFWAGRQAGLLQSLRFWAGRQDCCNNRLSEKTSDRGRRWQLGATGSQQGQRTGARQAAPIDEFTSTDVGYYCKRWFGDLEASGRASPCCAS